MLSLVSTPKLTSWSDIGRWPAIFTRLQVVPAFSLIAIHGFPQWPLGRKMRPVLSAARWPVSPPHNPPAAGSSPKKAALPVGSKVSPPFRLRLQDEVATWLKQK